ncbi:MAG: PKD domain-containing protein [Planctomycetes bacterium]|nr:PKD domain-containing protein [Planctomycetota bacterium]
MIDGHHPAPTKPVISAAADDFILPETVHFTATTYNTNLAIYEWDCDGDGIYDRVSSTGSAATFTYSVAGTYNAILRITNTSGLSATSNPYPITIQNPPQSFTLTLTATPASGTAPLAVTYQATASKPGIIRYEWDLDGDWEADTFTLTTQLSYTWTTAGNHSIGCTAVSNTGLKARATKVVPVEVGATPPTVTVTVNTETGVVPLRIMAVADAQVGAGQSITEYAWYLQKDGKRELLAKESSKNSVTLLIEEAGQYSVIAEVKASSGLTASDSRMIIAESPSDLSILLTLKDLQHSSGLINVKAKPRPIKEVADLHFEYRPKLEGTGGIILPETSRIQCTVLKSSAALTCDLYLQGIPDSKLIDNCQANEGYTASTTYPRGTELVFFIRIDGTGWGLGVYDHLSNTGYCQVERIDSTQFILRFEDLPSSHSSYDGDYNDAVIAVKLLPDAAAVAAASDWTQFSQTIAPPPYDFMTKWDLASFPNGTKLEVRAVATGKDSQIYYSNMVTIIVDNTNPDVSGTETIAGFKYRKTVNKNEKSEVELDDGTSVEVPPGLLTSDNDVIEVLRRNANPTTKGGEGIGAFRSISLDTTGAFSVPLTVDISFPDDNDDGYIDGYDGKKVSDLKMYTYNESTEGWDELYDSEIRSGDKKIRSKVWHLSEFALFSESPTSVSDDTTSTDTTTEPTTQPQTSDVIGPTAGSGESGGGGGCLLKSSNGN